MMIMLLHNHDPLCYWLAHYFKKHDIPCLALDITTLIEQTHWAQIQTNTGTIKHICYQNQCYIIDNNTIIYQQLMQCGEQHLSHYPNEEKAYALESWRALFNSFFFNHPRCFNAINQHNLLNPYPCEKKLAFDAAKIGLNLSSQHKMLPQTISHITVHLIGQNIFATEQTRDGKKKRIQLPRLIEKKCVYLAEKQYCTIACCHLTKTQRQQYYLSIFDPYPRWQQSAWTFADMTDAWMSLLLTNTHDDSTTEQPNNSTDWQLLPIENTPTKSCFIDKTLRPVL